MTTPKRMTADQMDKLIDAELKRRQKVGPATSYKERLERMSDQELKNERDRVQFQRGFEGK